MRFLARLVCICNICFIIAAILRLVEMGQIAKGNDGPALKFQPLESTIVILGYGAIFINIIFLFYFIYRVANKKIIFAPRWVIWFNVLMFPIQVYYFFYSHI
ncbi:MAG: hypothetical protein JSU03_08920 [Bacteroidetes bacterium]|nr:hypothetical protein [Bacteroidota bacterium]MBS1757385.1 hypothetical protein [Bacteroidota bacterium]